VRRKIHIIIALVLAGSLLSVYLAGRLQRSPPEPPPPSIERVRELADLVTLRVEVTDIHEARIDGYTGGVSVQLLVCGEVEVGCDLMRARLEEVDPRRACAVLVLPDPHVRSARLDHTRTKIARLERNGLWRIVPTDAGERALVERAIREAQASLTLAASERELVARGREHTGRLVGEFARSLNWELRIVWNSDGPNRQEHPRK
jgi:hypothetical protein